MKSLVCFLLGFSLIALLFFPLLNLYFTADDFFVLQNIKLNNQKNLLNFFHPNNQLAYYRPLGMQLYFFIANKLFGLRFFYYHLLSLIFLLINSYLVFILIKKITRLPKVGIIGFLLYGTSSIHYLSIAWAVNFSYILGTFFFLSAFTCWLEKKRTVFYVLFFLGLLVNELVVTLPIIIFFHSLFFKKKLKPLFFIFTLTALYLILRFFIFKTDRSGAYLISLNFKNIVNNYQWYFLWCLGWAEGMRDQFVNIYTLNPQTDFLINYSSQFYFYPVSMGIFILITGYLAIKNFSQEKKILFFGFFWFLAGLLPVIFFPHHAYAHYNTISLVGLALAMSVLLSKSQVVIIFLIVWIGVGITTVKLNSQIHWIIWHSQLSQKLVLKAQKEYSGGEKIEIKGNLKQNKLVLANQSAMKVVFNNDKIKTVYLKDD